MKYTESNEIEKVKNNIDKYITFLNKFHNILPITIEKDKLNLNELKYNNNLLRIIPNKKNHKFIKINTLYC